jgi:iron complex transport system substrate-binding protein
MKIVSTLPTGTEIVCALGLEPELRGVSHACHFPPSVASLPRVTATDFDYDGAGSGDIDSYVEGEMHKHRSLYMLDEELIRSLAPTHILTQEICDVCAVTPSDISRLVGEMPQRPAIVSINPRTLEEIIEEIERAGALLCVQKAAAALARRLRETLSAIRTRSAGAQRKSVFCMEWLDPIFDSGHWVPEMVDAAGGFDVIGRAGQYSRKVKWNDVREKDPEIIVLMPCSLSPVRTMRELHTVTGLPGWSDLRAARNRQVWIVDGSSYFNQSGPRVISMGIEILGKIIHPEIFGAPSEDEAFDIASP